MIGSCHLIHNETNSWKEVKKFSLISWDKQIKFCSFSVRKNFIDLIILKSTSPAHKRTISESSVNDDIDSVPLDELLNDEEEKFDEEEHVLEGDVRIIV